MAGPARLRRAPAAGGDRGGRAALALEPAEVARDRRRDEACAQLGWTVERVTWLQLVDEPEAVLRRIAGAVRFKEAA